MQCGEVYRISRHVTTDWPAWPGRAAGQLLAPAGPSEARGRVADRDSTPQLRKRHNPLAAGAEGEMVTEGQPSSAGRHRQGLRRLSPDQIGKASDDTAAQVSRIGLTFVGTAAFCLLSLLSPDNALLGGNDKLNVPLAGPVSFFGFMLLGPAVLIVLRVYLQIYVEHSDRLDRIVRRMPLVRAPTLVPLKNRLIRFFSGLTFYLLLPLAMPLFAWKAAVFPALGAGLFCVATAVIAGHAMLPLQLSWRSRALLSVSVAVLAAMLLLNPWQAFDAPSQVRGWSLVCVVAAVIAGQAVLPLQLSWPSRVLLSASVAILAGGAMLRLGPPRRSFDLFRANLSGQWLVQDDLSGADLGSANLGGADLSLAKLSGARLVRANLSGANLFHADLRDTSLGSANLSLAKLNGADLSGANLPSADLNGANLFHADLRDAELTGAHLHDAHLHDAKLNGADLSDADLSGAHNLTQAQLDQACGTGTQLPPSLTLKPCPEPAAPPAPGRP
jgi:uncharacterized protein YjbI with pentapeptide repeats